MHQYDIANMYAIALHRLSVIGPRRWQRLYALCGSLEAMWYCTAEQLQTAGVPHNQAQQILALRDTIRPADELERCYQGGYQITLHTQTTYPKMLQNIPDPPPVLLYRGNLDALTLKTCIAIVGSRAATPYGRHITTQLASEVARQGVCVVSGLALGIDAIAQQAVVENNGITVAVIGSGLDMVYPQSNKKLADALVEKNGCIISEFPLGTPPYRSNFPQRNRIIAGLAQAVIVTQAAKNSGSLITARYALEYNRDVGAVPGNITDLQAAGTNDLIRQGACAITSAHDILELIAVPYKDTPIHTNREYTEHERQILHLIQQEPRHVDQLIAAAALDSPTVLGVLSVLEVEGLIYSRNAIYYKNT